MHIQQLQLAVFRYLISQHPEVEQKIVEELAGHKLMPSQDGQLHDMQFEDLSRLTYLNCCIKVVCLESHTQCVNCCARVLIA